MTVGLLSVTTFPVILRERSEAKDLLDDGGSAQCDNFPCHPERAKRTEGSAPAYRLNTLLCLNSPIYQPANLRSGKRPAFFIAIGQCNNRNSKRIFFF